MKTKMRPFKEICDFREVLNQSPKNIHIVYMYLIDYILTYIIHIYRPIMVYLTIFNVYLRNVNQCNCWMYIWCWCINKWFAVEKYFSKIRYHFDSNWFFILDVSHSTPSLSPSPVVVLAGHICHGLSIIFSSPSICETFTLDIVSLASFLLAKNRIGIFRDLMSGFWNEFWINKTRISIMSTSFLERNNNHTKINWAIITCRSISSSSLATTIRGLSDESTTKTIPWHSYNVYKNVENMLMVGRLKHIYFWNIKFTL